MHQNLIETTVFLITLIALATGFIFLFSSKTSNLPMVKTFKESTTIRLITSGISVILAWISPWTSLKVMLFILAFILLISIFPIRKGKSSSLLTILIISFVILFIIPIFIAPILFMTNLGVRTSISNDNGIEINMPGIHIKVPQSSLSDDNISKKDNGIEINMPGLHINVPQSSLFDDNISKRETVLPDTFINIDNINNISIKIPTEAIELEFVENDNTLAYSSELIQKTEKDTIYLQPLFSTKNKTYVIKIGTQTAKELNIDCESIKITGNGNLKNIYINSTETKINANIQAENNMNINSVGFDLNGILKGKNLNLDTTGTNINGELNFYNMIINSTGANINIKSNFKNFNINSTSINGKIEILNSKSENANLKIDTLGGNLKIVNKNNSPVDIKTSGFINLIRE
ncbi:MAG TPA: hypothetical protein GXX15_12845 [Clostridia bacterium]|nr:hypothetical protein [Clostridia bacterium]